MPAELAWTRELPTAQGLYMFRLIEPGPAGPCPMAVSVFNGLFGWVAVRYAPPDVCSLEALIDKAEWLGPLPE